VALISKHGSLLSVRGEYHLEESNKSQQKSSQDYQE